MKYFLDTEFIEGFHKPFFGKKRHFIDLISIGIVAEDGREYYVISNEFDLDYAWSNKWVRENVLKQLHSEMRDNETMYAKTYMSNLFWDFSKKSLKNLLNWQGKSISKISSEIYDFTIPHAVCENGEMCCQVFGFDPKEDKDLPHKMIVDRDKPEFYAYFADYDWVLFCSLFGEMIDLPNFMPMYCNDLKQTLDEKANVLSTQEITDIVFGKGYMEHNVYAQWDIGGLTCHKSKLLMDAKSYSHKELQQANEHNALADAKWNYKLYKFLQTI